MKFNQFKFILFTCIAISFASCDWLSNDTTADPSTDPSFSSLTFAKNDSIPNLNSAVFTLVNDSLIVNLDSLPYQTRIDSVFPAFAFKSSAGTYLLLRNGVSVGIDGKDTIDFTQVVKVRNIAADGIAERTYLIKVNVHQANAELYVWAKANNNIYTTGGNDNQKGLLFNDKFFFYVNNGSENSLYTSTTGYTWIPGAVSGMPVNNTLRDMVEFNGKLYLSNVGNKIYSTSNGNTWVSSDYTVQNSNLVSFLFALNGKLWALTQAKSDLIYYFASSTNGADWVLGEKAPVNFPVRDFAALSFSTRNGKPKANVLGGYNAQGTLLKNSWSTEDGKYWVDFSEENRTMDKLAAGASVIAYDNKLFLFGLRNDTTNVSHYRVSKDEGFSWQVPDSTYNFLPTTFPARAYQSVVVFKPRPYNKLDSKLQIEESNRIFIMGGKSGSTVYSDVWTGKLNRKSFLVQ